MFSIRTVVPHSVSLTLVPGNSLSLTYNNYRRGKSSAVPAKSQTSASATWEIALSFILETGLNLYYSTA